MRDRGHLFAESHRAPRSNDAAPRRASASQANRAVGAQRSDRASGRPPCGFPRAMSRANRRHSARWSRAYSPRDTSDVVNTDNLSPRKLCPSRAGPDPFRGVSGRCEQIGYRGRDTPAWRPRFLVEDVILEASQHTTRCDHAWHPHVLVDAVIRIWLDAGIRGEASGGGRESHRASNSDHRHAIMPSAWSRAPRARTG